MCDCSTAPCSCETLTIRRGVQGRQGLPGVPPTLNFSVTPLPAGSTPTVSQSGGPATYDVAIGLPAGAPGAPGVATNGVDGVNAFVPTLTTFFVPAIGGAATLLQVFPFSLGLFTAPGQPVYLEGAGTFMVDHIVGTSEVWLINPGPLQWPELTVAGYPGNAIAGTSVLPGSKLSPGGRSGSAGAAGATGGAGAAGASASIPVVNTVPVVAPSPGQGTIIYTDSSTTPTFTQLYTWNGAAWVQSGNIQGAPGTLIVSTGGDPNSTQPAGPVGMMAIRTDILGIYTKTAPGVWGAPIPLTPTFAQVATQSSNSFGATAVYTQGIIGFEQTIVAHSSPGVYTYDLSKQSIRVTATADIELDWSDASYNKYGRWQFELVNTSGAPIAVTYTAATWLKATGLTLPSTLAAGAVQMFTLVQSKDGPVIENTYVVVAV